jgi:hypothetical protein
VVNLDGKERKIDVLRNVIGLGPKDLAAQAAELNVQDEGGSYVTRVLPPVILLHAKIANLATLDQEDRNDYKHVHLMLLVIRAYLSQLLEAVRDGLIESRDAIDQLERVRTTVTSPHAIKCTTAHAIDFSEIWPRQLLLEATDERIRNFVKHRLPPSE